MNATLCIWAERESNRISAAGASIGLETFTPAPIGKVARVDIHLQGSEPSCSNVLKFLIAALKPGVIINREPIMNGPRG